MVSRAARRQTNRGNRSMKKIEEIMFSTREMEILRKIRESVKSAVADSTIVFFGSRARGNSQEHSDWDVLILVERLSPEIKDRVYDVLYDVELEHDIIIGPLILLRDEWENKRFKNHPLHDEIDREGVLV